MNEVQNLKTAPAWGGATINSATDTDSTVAIDTKGYQYLRIAVLSGTVTAAGAGATVKVMESDVVGLTSPVEGTVLGSNGAFTADGDDNAVKSTTIRCSKRYAFLRITSGAGINAVFAGAVAILGGKRLPSDG